MKNYWTKIAVIAVLILGLVLPATLAVKFCRYTYNKGIGREYKGSFWLPKNTTVIEDANVWDKMWNDEKYTNMHLEVFNFEEYKKKFADDKNFVFFAGDYIRYVTIQGKTCVFCSSGEITGYPNNNYRVIKTEYVGDGQIIWKTKTSWLILFMSILLGIAAGLGIDVIALIAFQLLYSPARNPSIIVR